MDSTRKNHFNLDDFEKGLVLAGFLAPNSISELIALEQLEDYEKQLEKKKAGFFFKRSVLAAEITAKLYNEPSFGHIKLQKLLFLCENISKIGVKENYVKQAAGPYDRKFMHSIDQSFEKQKWFKIIKTKSGEFHLFKYEPAVNYGKHKSYFDKYFSQYNDRIQWLINTFGKVNTDKVEIVSTLFACWKGLIDKGIEPNEEEIISLFYDWSERKQQFIKTRLISAISWMKKNSLSPNDF